MIVCMFHGVNRSIVFVFVLTRALLAKFNDNPLSPSPNFEKGLSGGQAIYPNDWSLPSPPLLHHPPPLPPPAPRPPKI